MIVGVDISTWRVDLAWIHDGRPCSWHHKLGTPRRGKTPETHVIDRVRACKIPWNDICKPGYWETAQDITDVALEMPYSVNRDTNAKLMAILGAVTVSVPRWARVAWPSAGELRAAIGAKNTKAAAHHVITHPYLWEHLGHDNYPMAGWDEHELDALVACIGWTRILAAQEDAA